MKCNLLWFNSALNLEPNLSVIGNLSKSTSVLMLNGENDPLTPVQQSFLLEQRLTEVDHPDHTLITYPGLGHTFAISPQWVQGLDLLNRMSYQICIHGFQIALMACWGFCPTTS